MSKRNRADFLRAHAGGGYEDDLYKQRKVFDELNIPPPSSKQDLKTYGKSMEGSISGALRQMYKPLMTVDAYTRHRQLVANYLRYQKQHTTVESQQQEGLTLEDIVKDTYEFIRDEEKDEEDSDRWETRLAIKYYNKLYKEYALVDLSRYEEGKIGLRWRTEDEVIEGKGQFICGGTHCNNIRTIRTITYSDDGKHRERHESRSRSHKGSKHERKQTRNDEETQKSEEKEDENDEEEEVLEEVVGLHSYELPFNYVEKGERKSCLVKVRVCGECAQKLFYKKILDERKLEKIGRQVSSSDKNTRENATIGKERTKKKSKKKREGRKH